MGRKGRQGAWRGAQRVAIRCSMGGWRECVCDVGRGRAFRRGGSGGAVVSRTDGRRETPTSLRSAQEILGLDHHAGRSCPGASSPSGRRLGRRRCCRERRWGRTSTQSWSLSDSGRRETPVADQAGRLASSTEADWGGRSLGGPGHGVALPAAGGGWALAQRGATQRRLVCNC